MFQSISVGSTVTLEVCRGYPLPFDPNDPNTEVVTTIAVDSHLQTVSNNKRLANLDTNYNFLDADDLSRDESSTLEAGDDIDDLLKGLNNLTVGKVEVRVRIVKGTLGFGFTIADSACGQRVKKILDRQRCKNLLEGDILLEINDICLQSLSHDEVVQVLKNCPYNSEATICVQRGCASKAPARAKPRKLDNRFGKEAGAYRSKTPTADIYSTQPREVLPSRPKTPIVDTRGLSKTPVKDLNSNTSELFKRDFDAYGDRSHLRLSLIENHDAEDEAEISDLVQGKAAGEFAHADPKYCLYMPIPHRLDCVCYNCQNHRSSASNGGFEGNGKLPEWWQIGPNPEFIEMNVTLQRHETGFGFRIVGGIEDRSQVTSFQFYFAKAANDLGNVWVLLSADLHKSA